MRFFFLGGGGGGGGGGRGSLFKTLSGIPLACHTVWIQIRPDKKSGLILVQAVFKREEL